MREENHKECTVTVTSLIIATQIYICLITMGILEKKTFIARNSDRKIRLLNERVSPDIVGYNVQAVG